MNRPGPKPKFTEEQVRAIRERYSRKQGHTNSQRAIARVYGVSAPLIRDICDRRIYAWVS